jgi:hypothetical protein
MSDDLLQALRRAHNELKVEVNQSAQKLMDAQRDNEAVRARYTAFRTQLDDVCSAAGFPVSAVIDEGAEPGDPDGMEKIPAHRTSWTSEHPIALLCRPGSLRWYAGEALNRLGGEGSIAAIANEMRRMGYKHNRAPARSNQLEQSLAALPSQVHWIVQGKARGELRLVLER